MRCANPPRMCTCTALCELPNPRGALLPVCSLKGACSCCPGPMVGADHPGGMWEAGPTRKMSTGALSQRKVSTIHIQQIGQLLQDVGLSSSDFAGEQELMLVLQELDHDGDGLLNLREVMALVRQHMEKGEGPSKYRTQSDEGRQHLQRALAGSKDRLRPDAPWRWLWDLLLTVGAFYYVWCVLILDCNAWSERSVQRVRCPPPPPPCCLCALGTLRPPCAPRGRHLRLCPALRFHLTMQHQWGPGGGGLPGLSPPLLGHYLWFAFVCFFNEVTPPPPSLGASPAPWEG